MYKSSRKCGDWGRGGEGGERLYLVLPQRKGKPPPTLTFTQDYNFRACHIAPVIGGYRRWCAQEDPPIICITYVESYTYGISKQSNNSCFRISHCHREAVQKPFVTVPSLFSRHDVSDAVSSVRIPQGCSCWLPWLRERCLVTKGCPRTSRGGSWTCRCRPNRPRTAWP